MSTTKKNSLIGRRFGRLLVITKIHNPLDNRAACLCVCSCGKKKTVRLSDLIRGKVKSCGCYKSDFLIHLNNSRRVHIDMKKKYGLLKPTKLVKTADNRQLFGIICKCDCNSVVYIRRVRDVVSGHTKSCGCLKYNKSGDE